MEIKTRKKYLKMTWLLILTKNKCVMKYIYHNFLYLAGVNFSSFLKTFIKYPLSAKPHCKAISSIDKSEKRSKDFALEMRCFKI